jgi:hypothetical protein
MASNSGLPLVMIFIFIAVLSAISAGVGSYTCTGGTWDYTKFDSELCTVWPDDTSTTVGPTTPPPSSQAQGGADGEPQAVLCQEMTTVGSCLGVNGCTWDDTIGACRLQNTEDTSEGCSSYSSEYTCPADCEWNAAQGTCDDPPACDLAFTNDTCQRTPALFQKCVWDTKDYVCRERVGCEKIMGSEECNAIEACEWTGSTCIPMIPAENKPCDAEMYATDGKACYNDEQKAVGFGWAFNNNEVGRLCQEKVNQYKVKLLTSANDYQTKYEWTLPGTAESVGVKDVPETFWGSTMKFIVDAYDINDELIAPRGTISMTLDDTKDSDNCEEVGISLSELPEQSGTVSPAPEAKDCVVNDNMYTLGPCTRNGITLDGGGSGEDASKRCGYGVRRYTLDRNSEGFEAEENGGSCVEAKFHPSLCQVPCAENIIPENCGWVGGEENWYSPTKSDGKVHCMSRPDAGDDIGTCNDGSYPSSVYLEKRELQVNVSPVETLPDGSQVAINSCPATGFRYKTCTRCPIDCAGYWTDTDEKCTSKYEVGIRTFCPQYLRTKYIRTKNGQYGGNDSCPANGAKSTEKIDTDIKDCGLPDCY